MLKRKTGLIIAAVMAVALAAAFLTYNSNKSTAENPDSLTESAFPQAIQGLPLAQILSGPQAIGMISKLHGSDITIKQGYIATYQGNQAQILIWISESNNEKDAVELFEIMDRKIAKPEGSGSGQPPFTERREIKSNGTDVIAVKGMGMENYYYQIGNKVYWIAAGGVDPLKTLEEVLNTL